MPPRRTRDQQNDDAPPPPPPPPPPQLTPYERASVDMLAEITRLLERQSEQPGKSHEEDGPPKGRTPQGPQLYIPQGQKRPQQQGANAPRPGGTTTCKEFHNNHPGQCMAGSGRCYHCKETGKICRDCPKKRQSSGCVYVMQAKAADPDTTLIIAELVLFFPALELLRGSSFAPFPADCQPDD
ncbi:hypothetical protein F511_19379 [Dorcoceras hygrometricum]|uniref:CCHC-type domain-containing protein n=1 Tax=Dorcoceras hygrometricum TaxID=472368 RepID=A0A2Z7BJ49_9LAMI|nr:hypothetical protein F511_19379 [Dorcoceras hygrometricum]